MHTQISSALRTKLLTIAVAVFGYVTWLDMRHFQITSANRFFTYLILALISGAMKVKVPRLKGRLSFSFIFMLLSIVDLSRQETLFIGSVLVFVELYLWTENRITPLQAIGALGDTWLATCLAYWVYHAHFWVDMHAPAMAALASAALILALVGTFPVPVLVALFDQTANTHRVAGKYRWTIVYYLAGALFASTIHVSNAFTGWRDSIVFIPVFYLVCQSCRIYLERIEHDRIHAEDMVSLHLRTIEALALAIGAKDRATYQRMRRVQVYAVEIGKEVGLSLSEMDALRVAAILHDIGKLAIPENIIVKPGKLTNEEFDKVRIHPEVAAEILERVRFPYPVVPIVRSHHERWDGKGYPNGLKSTQIPLAARVLSVVTSYVALTSDRHYRAAFPPDGAIQIIVSESGMKFDPKVVEILERRYRDLDEISRRSLIDDTDISAPEQLLTSSSTPATISHGCPPTDDSNPLKFVDTIAAAHREVQTLLDLSQHLGTSLSLHDTLSMVASGLRDAVPHDGIVIRIVRENRLVPEFVSGEDVRFCSGVEVAIGEGVCGRVAAENQPVLNGDPAVENGASGMSVRPTLQSLLAVPLKGTREVIGVLSLYRKEQDGFSKDHLRVLLALASKVALSIENALRFRQAESSATTDYLTGLPNARSLFLHLDAELARCRRNRDSLALVVSDLDGFKQVNDRFGHLRGNELLKAIAKRLRENIREYDYVARMGGDEFVIVFPSLSLESVAEKLRQLDTAVRAASAEKIGEELVGLSTGCAFFPADGSNAEELLAQADRRMYGFKQRRKNGTGYDAADPVARALAGLPANRAPAARSIGS